MQLKITGGKLKGKKIIHKYKISIRPTSSKVRESIFNRIVNSNFPEKNTLNNSIRFTDIFCGSGFVFIKTRLPPWVQFSSLAI